MQNTVNKSVLYNYIKVITTILVVIGHATVMYTSNGAIPVANQSLFLKRLTEYLYAFHMPLFIFISGCVFGYCIEQGKYNDKIGFIINKTKKLLIPYFCIGIFYVAPVMQLLHLSGTSFVNYVFHGIVFSFNSRHLWYLFALFWIFIIAIILKPLIHKGTKGYLLLSVISLLLYTCFYKGIVPGYFQLSAAFSYQIFFFAGVLFNLSYKKAEILFQKVYLASFILPLCLTGIFVYNPNVLSSFVYKFIGIAMLLILCWFILYRAIDFNKYKLYQIISKDSFGIYLFHPMIIYVIYFVLGQYDINPILLSSFAVITAVIFSVLATEFIRKMKLLFIIGE